MAMFVEGLIRERAQTVLKMEGFAKSAGQLNQESAGDDGTGRRYDIFLSHSIRDAELVLGMKATLEDLRYSVYVDWIDDAQLDRGRVNADTAARLRRRMDSSLALFFMTTENSDKSRWMPWECGYCDGKHGKVAIAPIVSKAGSNAFDGQEYLGVYPYVCRGAGQRRDGLWVHKNRFEFVEYESWIKTKNNHVRWSTTGELWKVD